MTCATDPRAEISLRARRNIFLLALSQALYSCCVITVFATGSLAGLMLTPSKNLATLPITTFIIGSALSTIPASLLMQRVGRKPIFFIGTIACLIGAILAAQAIFLGNFALFCCATALQGMYQATSGFYRFAAVEGSPPEMKPRAISWVLTGGVVAAVVGTVVSTSTADLFIPYTFVGSYLAVAGFCVAALIVLSFLQLPKPTHEEISGPRRSWAELLRNKRLPVAIISSALAYAMMNLMMTAAPIAMVGCGFTQGDSAWVIQWHVLAMFVPSFFTGSLIVRYGAERITAIGLGLIFTAAIVGYAGITFGNFALALVLLGLGWNFAYIGATTLLTTTYHPSERGKVQGTNDFIVALTVATASYGSGLLLASGGWGWISLVMFPLSLLALALVGGLAWHLRAGLKKTL